MSRREQYDVVSYNQRVKDDGRIDLSAVSAGERATVQQIAKSILKWDGMKTDVKVKGTTGAASTTLSVVPLNPDEPFVISVPEWCKTFHTKKNLKYNSVLDTKIIGELRVELENQSAADVDVPDIPRVSDPSYIPIHKSVSKRAYTTKDRLIPIEDDDDDADDDDRYLSRRRRPYIPK